MKPQMITNETKEDGKPKEEVTNTKKKGSMCIWYSGKASNPEQFLATKLKELERGEQICR